MLLQFIFKNEFLFSSESVSADDRWTKKKQNILREMYTRVTWLPQQQWQKNDWYFMLMLLQLLFLNCSTDISIYEFCHQWKVSKKLNVKCCKTIRTCELMITLWSTLLIIYHIYHNEVKYFYPIAQNENWIGRLFIYLNR